ncbi:dihydrofolate reductase [Lacibacter sp. H407]|uniref:dihydrofolate reductase n=1 Tax=Lacibacter sp. H407 TaxID=3133423 RepID=UPI0030C2DED9
MIISLIVAASSNNAIGRNNELLWHLPIDLKFFKNTTWALPVIMGRKTFESVGSKPLTGRTNIIVSRQEGLTSQYDNVWFAASLDEAIEQAKKLETKEIMIAGGAQIYEQALPISNRIYLTRVHVHLEADAFFPPFPLDEWNLTRNSDFEANEKHAYSFSIQQWDRK